MNLKLIERLRDIQATIKSVGFGVAPLALPAPKVLLLPAPNAEERRGGLYEELVTEPEIVDVSRDLFESAFYNQAVTEAFKAVDLFVQDKVNRHDLSGTELMQLVFSTEKPILS